jgi:hypothetical protein
MPEAIASITFLEVLVGEKEMSRILVIFIRFLLIGFYQKRAAISGLFKKINACEI